MKNRLLLTFVIPFLLISLIFSLVAFILYNQKYNQMVTETKIEIKNNLVAYENQIIEKTERMTTDSHFLSSLVDQLYINSFVKPTAEDFNKTDLYFQTIVNFCKNSNNYKGVKLIDIEGKEVINIQYYAESYGSFLNENIDYLKDEGFRIAKFLDKDNIYFSKLNNTENFSIYEPVYNYKKEVIAVIIIDAYTEVILEKFIESDVYRYEYIGASGNIFNQDINERINTNSIRESNPTLFDEVLLNEEGFFINKNIFAYYKHINLYGTEFDTYASDVYVIDYLNEASYQSNKKSIINDFIKNIIIALLLSASISVFWSFFRKKENAHKKMLKKLAYKDHLTNIYNREFFMKQLNESISNKIPFSLIYFDVDDFKSINDNYGHDCGDFVLIEISKFILNVLRKGDMVARIGGDEFNVCLYDAIEKKQVIDVLERISNAFNQPIIYKGNEIIVLFSIGVSSFPDDADNLNEMLLKADTAMYYIKKKEKNGYMFYNELEEKEVYNERLHLST